MNALTKIAAAGVELLPDGVYLHLPEEQYFPQGMGSTGWCKLYLRREGWWWSSDLNPDHVDKPNEAKDFGHGFHKRVGEGDAAYDACFVAAPDKKAIPGLCITAEDVRAELLKHGLSPKKSATKGELIDLAHDRLPDLPIWADIWNEFAKGLNGRTALSPQDDRAVRVMTDLLRADPEIGPLLRFSHDHMPIAEISVIYTDEFGIRRRARLDLMLPSGTIDFKTMMGNFTGKPLAFSVPEIVAKMAYHVQMADHHIARRRAYRFIAEGKVYGASDAEVAWLKRFPGEAPHWGYAWIFHQKPDAVEGKAPVVFPWWENFGDDLHRRGLRCLYEAIATYRRCMAEFGPDRPWTRVEPLHVSTEGSPDRVFIPHWIGGDQPLPDEEELLEA